MTQITGQQMQLGLDIMEAWYIFSTEKQNPKFQVLRFYAIANIAISEPIFDTMTWKFVEYIYLSKLLLNTEWNIESGLQPSFLHGIPQIFDINIEITEGEIWDEIKKVYREDFQTKKSRNPDEKYLKNKIKKLRDFLGGLELLPPRISKIN